MLKNLDDCWCPPNIYHEDVLNRLENIFQISCYSLDELRYIPITGTKGVIVVSTSLGTKTLEEAIYHIKNIDFYLLKYGNKCHRFTDDEIEQLELIKAIL